VRLVLFGSDVELAAGFRNAWATSTLGAIDGDAVQIPQIQQAALSGPDNAPRGRGKRHHVNANPS
jgi:hypothetical protein